MADSPTAPTETEAAQSMGDWIRSRVRTFSQPLPQTAADINRAIRGLPPEEKLTPRQQWLRSEEGAADARALRDARAVLGLPPDPDLPDPQTDNDNEGPEAA